MDSPGVRLRAARVAAGFKSAPEAAEALGVPEPTYMAHENNSRGFARRAEAYAKKFKTTPEWLLFGKGGGANLPFASGPTSENVGAPVHLSDLKAYLQAEKAVTPLTLRGPKPVDRRVPVMGRVEAGAWSEASPRTINDVEEWLPIDVPGYERAQLTSLRVSGPSMNQVYPPGRYVVIASPIEAGVRVGDHVVVQRHKADLVEITLKEFAVDADGRIALWPRSYHADHQAPIYLTDGGDADQTAPVIIGVVVADYAKRDRPPVSFQTR